jgi:hypothetical protein
VFFFLKNDVDENFMRKICRLETENRLCYNIMLLIRNISHGELLRVGYDETLTVDPSNLQFLIQGVSDERKAVKKYGEIPWQLGLLTPK